MLLVLEDRVCSSNQSRLQSREKALSNPKDDERPCIKSPNRREALGQSLAGTQGQGVEYPVGQRKYTLYAKPLMISRTWICSHAQLIVETRVSHPGLTILWTAAVYIIWKDSTEVVRMGLVPCVAFCKPIGISFGLLVTSGWRQYTRAMLLSESSYA